MRTATPEAGSTTERRVVGFVLSLLSIYREYAHTDGRMRRCRFEPSCSRYAEACFSRYGLLRGGLLAVRRIRRCGPEAVGGIDLPPA